MCPFRSAPTQSSRPLPKLDKPYPNHVVLVEYKRNEIAKQELIPRKSRRLVDAMNEAAARPKEVFLFCGCNPNDPQGLGLRTHGYQQVLLVCKPNSKSKHAFSCGYHGAATATDGERLPFNEHHDANWRVMFATPKAVLKAPPKLSKKEGNKGKPNPKTPRKRKPPKPTELVSSLLHVMDAAGTNEFDPSLNDLSPNALLKRLHAALGLSDEDGQRDDRREFVLGADRDPASQELLDAIKETPAGIAPIVVIAELERVDASEESMLMLQLRNSNIEVRVRTSRWSYARKRSNSRAASAALNALSGGDFGMRVFLQMHLVKDASGHLEAQRTGIVITNAKGIPVESRYELQMANHLVATGRHFIKPLFRKNGYPYLHDFLLLDVGEPFFIEVNGMAHEAYVRAKQKSTAFLEETAPGRYLVWWALQEECPIHLIPAISAG